MKVTVENADLLLKNIDSLITEIVELRHALRCSLDDNVYLGNYGRRFKTIAELSALLRFLDQWSGDLENEGKFSDFDQVLSYMESRENQYKGEPERARVWLHYGFIVIGWVDIPDEDEDEDEDFFKDDEEEAIFTCEHCYETIATGADARILEFEMQNGDFNGPATCTNCHRRLLKEFKEDLAAARMEEEDPTIETRIPALKRTLQNFADAYCGWDPDINSVFELE